MNGLELTRRCIEGVLKSKEPLELILTDNASTDGTAEYFESLKSTAKRPIRVIHNEVNKGFSEPHNHALTLAQGTYFVALNNDVEVPPGWLTKLEQPFKDNEKAAITGPAGSCCSLVAPYPSFHGSPGATFEYVEGSCLCIPTALARSNTLFAPYLHFAYAEDVDLSLRMRAAGYTIHPADFTIVHHRAQTAKNIPNIDDIKRRNHAVMLKRWGNYLQFKKFDLPIVVRRKGAIGDVLLTVSLIEELKASSPRSEIFVETAFPQIFLNNTDVTKAGGPFPEVYRWARMIDLDMSYENMTETNIVDAYFKAAYQIPCPLPSPARLYPTAEQRAAAADRLGKKKWVAVHPGPSTWPGKNWPMDRWEKLCQWLLEKQWKVLLVGTPGPALPNYLDLRGKTNFQELQAAIECCKLFIGIDSFPIHVAQGAYKPVVGLFGATTPEYILTGDFKAARATTPCAGERHRVSGATFTPCAGECMNSITLDMVKELIP